MDFAKKYLEANEQAIKNIKSIIDLEKINCDFEYQDNYIFTKDINFVNKIKDENKILNSIWFKNEYIENTSLPFNSITAIKFPNQAQFHPVKYIFGLVNCIIKNNGKIFENTKAYGVKREGSIYTIYTKDNIIKSKYVILASHYLIINTPGFYFLKMYQSMSYLIGIDADKTLPNGMYIKIVKEKFMLLNQYSLI